MRLTVFGATAAWAARWSPRALDAGHHVTAYVRNPAKLELTHPNLAVISGELTDREAVKRAVSGTDAVIGALGPSLDRKATGMPLVDGTRTIVEAMRAEGVERYIGMATPSLRDPRDGSSLLGRVVPFMGRTVLKHRPSQHHPRRHRRLPARPSHRRPLQPRRTRHQQLTTQTPGRRPTASHAREP
jgi:nucleoside-diphosphate-sugar epimerase